jgi:PAS domain S-box-containing protein
MKDSILLSLVQNIALLLSFSVLYEYLWVKGKEYLTLKHHILCGILIGVVGIILMLTTYEAGPGMVFDTRSVMLSISGLFFGAIPTIIGMAITALYRIALGGTGVYMGVAVIFTSGIIGILWKRMVPSISKELRWVELLLMGFVVHVVMLFCTFLLPNEVFYDTISYLIFPLLTIYPLGNMLLGLFMYRHHENRKQRLALNSSEKKFHSLYESMNDAYAVLDLELNIKEFNTAFVNMLGYDKSDLLDLNCKDLTPEIWRELDQKIIRESVEINGHSEIYEKECIKKDGSLIPVEISIHQRFDQYENPCGYWVVLRDISVRKNFIRQLENEQSRLKTLLETVPEMIWLKDKNGIYISCNQQFASFNGMEVDELIGKSDHALYDADTADYYFQKDLEVMEKSELVRFVCWAEPVKGGERILTETIKTPMHDSKGNFIGVLGVSRDISELKKAEDELILAKEKAEESDKLKSIFLANMSHEIRTPMNAIMGFSELLVDSGIDDVERLQYVNIIQNSGNRLLQIIDDIVDISKLELNQVAIKKVDVNLFELFTNSINTFHNSELLRSKQSVELKLNYPDDYQNLSITTDPNRFLQILDNLVNNAIKFTEVGNVELGFNMKKIDAQSYIEVYVKDQGIGIPHDKKEVIFERFRQGDEEQFNDGTGLGLTICKGLVELMSGDIYFESEEGEGSTFYFTIPFIENEKQKEISMSNSSQSNDLNRKKILVAETDYNSFLYIQKLFEDECVEILHADNANAFINHLKQSNPDLVIVDVNIPGNDYLTCLDELKNIKTESKVIAQSAYAVKGEEERCRQAGCHGYITKPFSKEQLMKEVNNAMS